MTVKELLIKFQEYQLEYKVLNANFAHNAAANLFMERYGVKNCSIPDVMESVCEICGKPAFKSDNLCFEHLVCNVPKPPKQTDC